MEYVNGGSLANSPNGFPCYIDWTLEQRLSFAVDMAHGVLHLHHCGIVHLDLYEKNILVHYLYSCFYANGT